MRQEQDYCKRCGNPIETDMIGKTDICGSCADDLRGDEKVVEWQEFLKSEGIE